eukprot:TRINITY_DN45801_c0_g1_i1.p1 TRINITY_DN45801_c0_g1~~TRINITY_DN45801_c0_g1_i1.p1  ORF type:complete len:485 (+),score=74.21 TRINITY_DN45801_c0_g1_i1:96-1550(+)
MLYTSKGNVYTASYNPPRKAWTAPSARGGKEKPMWCVLGQAKACSWQATGVTVHPVVASCQQQFAQDLGPQVLVGQAVLPAAHIGSIVEATRLADPVDAQSLPVERKRPDHGAGWNRFECDLYRLSRGVYDPTEMARRRRLPSELQVQKRRRDTGCLLEVKGRVSVVVPTMCSRQRYHEQLYLNFCAQTYPDKELIVLESYEDRPSSFLQQKAKEDHRLVHVCFQRSADEDFSVGLKRNMTLHLASGEYVVNFDDDDVYAHTYVTKMVDEMRRRGLVGVTLSTWYNYFEHNGEIGYSDPMVAWEDRHLMTKQDMDEVLYGYGFSYAHRRQPSMALPYPDVVFAEDAPFFLRLKQVYGDRQVALKPDEDGFCMHLVHNANSAGDMPISRQLTSQQLKRLDVSNIFSAYLQRQESILVPHLRSVVEGIDQAVQSLSGLWRRGSLSSAPAKEEACDVPSASVGARLTSLVSCDVGPSRSLHRRIKSC